MVPSNRLIKRRHWYFGVKWLLLSAGLWYPVAIEDFINAGIVVLLLVFVRVNFYLCCSQILAKYSEVRHTTGRSESKQPTVCCFTSCCLIVEVTNDVARIRWR